MKKIQIVSPAKKIEQDCIDFAAKFFRNNGFEVEISKIALGQNNYFSGTDAERLNDFQAALNDDSVDFILCSRGGYGAVRIIDELNFDSLKKKFKLIIGFSDITVFHNHVHGLYNLPTLHATVPLNFRENSQAALDSLLNVLNQQKNEYHISANKHNKIGEVDAIVVGGNLSILYSLIGTNSDIDLAGKILFIEDIGEPIYAIDRMFFSLEKSGKLKNLAGLIVGGLTGLKDTEPSYNQTPEEIISERVSKYKFPVCFDFPAGHIDDNRAILFGTKARLKITKEEVIFSQENHY